MIRYNDTAIADELLEIVTNNESYDEILAKDHRWALLYHLSPLRKNIINWYPFKADSTCLEIGGECGAITGVLCGKLKYVTVIEAIEKWATINNIRHHKHKNLKIISGSLAEVEFNEKFDYITLIGGLEHAEGVLYKNSSCRDLLEQIKELLKPKGKLIIATNNRYGMKYLAGAKEDCNSKIFSGITGKNRADGVRTFGLSELVIMLRESGFPMQSFYFPHPDYIMPLEIYSQEYLPRVEAILSKAPNYDCDRYELFDETDAFREAIKNNKFEFFANSYLIICEIE